MKIIGLLVIVVGLAAAIFYAVIPAQVTVLGSYASCGIPLVSTSTQSTDAATQECAQESGERLIAAGVFALAGTIGGGILAVAGQREEDRRR